MSVLMDNLHLVIQGFLLWLSLMVAIGPQNALVIKQGLRRHGLGAVMAVVILSDIVLVALGILGVGVVVDRAPWLLTILKWAGVTYLVWFATTCFRDARNPSSLTAHNAQPTPVVPTPEAGGGVALMTRPVRTAAPVRPVIITALAMSWLNPGAYIDAVMLGSLANQYGNQAIALGTGALCATLMWFPFLGFGARALSPYLSRPRVWAGINVVIGLMILAIATKIALTM